MSKPRLGNSGVKLTNPLEGRTEPTLKWLGMSYDLALTATVFLLWTCGVSVQAQNDDFADAIDLSAEAPGYTQWFGLAGTAEPDEPAHAGSAAANSIWFQLSVAEDRTFSLTDWLGMETSRIAVYTGGRLDQLVVVSEGTGRVYFEAQASERYSIAVDSAGGKLIYLRTLPQGGADERGDADVLPAALPQRIQGNNIFATRNAETDDDLLLQDGWISSSTVWWRWTAPSSGAVRLDGRPSDFFARLLVYEEVPGGVPVFVGVDAFAVTEGYHYYIRIGNQMQDREVFPANAISDESFRRPGEIDVWMEWIPSGVPANDDVAAARDLGDAAIACDDGWIFHATTEPGVFDEQAWEKSIWWKWTCPKTGYYRASSIGSDTFGEGVFVGVFDGEPTALSYIGGGRPGIRFMGEAGVVYWIRIKDYSAHVELSVYPAHTESPYFAVLEEQRYLQPARILLRGAERLPGADPDGDSFSNLMELVCGTNPEANLDADLGRLPRLEGEKFTWYVSDYRSGEANQGEPSRIHVVGQAAAEPGGPWQSVLEPEGEGDFELSLPAGARGFARLLVRDLNLELP